MRIEVDRDSNSVKFWDSKGQRIHLNTRSVEVKLLPHQPTMAYLEVYCDEVDVTVEDDLLDSRRVGHGRGEPPTGE